MVVVNSNNMHTVITGHAKGSREPPTLAALLMTNELAFLVYAADASLAKVSL